MPHLLTAVVVETAESMEQYTEVRLLQGSLNRLLNVVVMAVVLQVLLK